MKVAGGFSHNVDIPADPETVFWTLLDPENASAIDSSFEYWQPREGPPQIGTQNDFKAKVGAVTMKGVSRFVAFDPPHRHEIHPPNGGFRGARVRLVGPFHGHDLRPQDGRRGAGTHPAL